MTPPKTFIEEELRKFDEEFVFFREENRIASHKGNADEIKHFLSQSHLRLLMKVQNKVIDLRKEFANTPINERGNGWDWLDKVADTITSITEEYERNT